MQSQKASSQDSNTESFGAQKLMEIINNFSIDSNKKLENNVIYFKFWNQFLDVLIICMGILMSCFDEKDEKINKKMNQSVEYIRDLLPKGNYEHE